MHRPKQVTLVTPCHHHEAVGLVEVAGDLRDEFRGPDAFFFNDTATTEIYTLSLHDALPISCPPRTTRCRAPAPRCRTGASARRTRVVPCWASAGRSLPCPRPPPRRRRRRSSGRNHARAAARPHRRGCVVRHLDPAVAPAWPAPCSQPQSALPVSAHRRVPTELTVGTCPFTGRGGRRCVTNVRFVPDVGTEVSPVDHA